MDAPVSVIIPTYNAQRFVQKAIDSVLAQTYPHFELIIIDNASEDDTPAIAQSYVDADERVRLIQNEENLGFTRSISRALEATKYEYVAKIDAADWMPPHRLESQKRYLDECEDVALVSGNIELYDEQYDFIRTMPYSDRYLPVELLFGCYISHSAMMYRRSVAMRYGGYDVRLIRAEDYDLWMKMLMGGHRMVTLPEVMSCELVYRGQGSDFYRQEEREIVLRMQVNALERITGDLEMAEMLLGLAQDDFLRRVSSDDVFETALYFCRQLPVDLCAFYPYELDSNCVEALKSRLAAYIQRNYLNTKGRAALRAARSEGWDIPIVLNGSTVMAMLRRVVRSLIR